MISVLLFKIKKWYANALKEYQDSKVSEMQDRVYHGRTYTDMQPLYKTYAISSKEIEKYYKGFAYKKRKHSKTKKET